MITGCDGEPARGERVNLDPGLPGNLADRVGSSWSHGLLAPRPSPNVGDRYDQVDVAGLRGERSRRTRCDALRSGAVRGATSLDMPGGAAASAAAPPTRAVNHSRYVAGSAQKALHRRARCLTDIGRRTSREDRFHDRLLQPDGARDRLGISPAFERVVIGQYEIAQRRRLVRIAGEGDLERHLGECRGELHACGRAVHRIGAAHEDERHATGIHTVDERGEVRHAGNGTAERRNGFGRFDGPANVA